LAVEALLKLVRFVVIRTDVILSTKCQPVQDSNIGGSVIFKLNHQDRILQLVFVN
jgi:hypothetical protein